MFGVATGPWTVWSFGVTTKALGRDKGKLRGRVVTNAQDGEAVHAAARTTVPGAPRLGLGCAHCAHNPVLKHCTV